MFDTRIKVTNIMMLIKSEFKHLPKLSKFNLKKNNALCYK